VWRELGEGYELDDDPARVDLDAVHAYINLESYWGRGRPRAITERAIEGSSRVLGLYHRGALVGFARAVSDGATFAYLADVYVLAEHRGRGLGLELVREMLDGGPRWAVRWLLYTADAQGLYAKLGFVEGPPAYPRMERPREVSAGARADDRGARRAPFGARVADKERGGGDRR
jgi:GNAT superfamily N-acetyltransferase